MQFVVTTKHHSELSNLIHQFFSPPIPDPRDGTMNSADVEDELESDHDNQFNSESNENILTSQLQFHLAGIKAAENLDVDADVDVDIEADNDNGISNDSDPNITFIIDNDAENNPTNSSEAFRQFKELLENTTNPAEAICGSAKLMNMLTIGCDKGSVTMDAKYKSRRERWFTKKAEAESNCRKVRKSKMSDI